MKTRFRNNLSLRLATVAAVLAASASARAATFNVTDTAGLASALATAQNNNEDDVINLAAGTYDASGASFTYIADNTAGSEENFRLTLVGENRGTTILDGGNLKQVLAIKTRGLTGGDDNADISISNLTFQNGNATGATDDFGGGLLADTNDSPVTVDNCLFKDNFAPGGGGGAEILARLSNAVLTDSIFIGNSTDADSGGVEVFGNVNSTAINNVFFDNHAAGVAGGALIQFNSGDGVGERILVVNNTAISNGAGTDGGGIFVGLTDGDPERADIFNNIMFGNTAAGVGDDLFLDDAVSTQGAPILLSNNDIGQFVSDCDVDAACTPHVTEQANLSLAPGLVDPANGNFHLASSSPLIDQGSADAPSLPDLDFEGESRVQGATPDIGADESVSCGDGVVAGSEECDDGNTADGDCCNSDCQFEAADSTCDDGDAGTENDLCDGAGACEGTLANNGGGCSLVR